MSFSAIAGPPRPAATTAVALGRRFALAGILVLAALLATACDRNPFWVMNAAPDENAAMLVLPDRAGIVVLPIVGLDEDASRARTTAIVEALLEANIPASDHTGAGNRQSYFLSVVADPSADAGSRLSWDLLDASGVAIVGGTTPDVGDAAVSGAAIAKAVAVGIQDDLGSIATGDTARERLRIVGLDAAPGDGATTVPRVMAHLLERAGYDVTAEDQPAIQVSGHLDIAPADTGSERVSILWRVVDPAGHEVGTVAQDNVVPAGSLDGSWGDAAYYVALGAAEGVHGLLANRDDPATAPQ